MEVARDMLEFGHHPFALFSFTASIATVAASAVAMDPPDPQTGMHAYYLAVGGLITASATLLGVIGDKLGPHAVACVRIWAETRAEAVKNQEARHRLTNELQTQALRSALLEDQIDTLKRQVNDFENLYLVEKAKHEVAINRNAASSVAIVENWNNPNPPQGSAVEPVPFPDAGRPPAAGGKPESTPSGGGSA